MRAVPILRAALRTSTGCPDAHHTDSLHFARRIVRSTSNPRCKGRTTMTRKSTILSRHKLTRSIAIGATAIALAGGGYGIVSATASTGSGAATTAASPSRHQGNPRPAAGDPTLGLDRPQGDHPARSTAFPTSSFTISTSAGQKVTVNKASSTTYQKGTSSTRRVPLQRAKASSYLGRPAERRSRPARSSCNRPRRRIRDFLGGRGGPLPARRTVHVKAGRSDPSELQSGVGDDRQRNDSE